MYIKVEEDGSVRKFNLNEIRVDADTGKTMPGRVFRTMYNDAELAEMGVYRAFDTPKPDHSAKTHKVEFDTAQQDEQGKWYIVWKVVAKSQEEIDAYNKSLREALEITARQARLVLNYENMLDDVENWVATSGDKSMQIEWEYGTTVKRLSPFVVQYAQARNIPDEEMDRLFMGASNL